MTQQTAQESMLAQRAQRARNAYARVSKREGRHWLAAKTLAVSALFGMGTGMWMSATSSGDDNRKDVGSGIILATLALGLTGGEVLRRKLAKDADSLEKISRDLPKDFSSQTESRIYNRDPITGQYETFGTALSRVKLAALCQGTVGGVSGLTAGATFLNAVGRYPVMTDAIYNLSAQIGYPVTIGGAGTVASIAQGTLTIAFAGIAAVAAKAAYDNKQNISTIKEHIRVYGENARRNSELKGVTPS